MSVPDLAPDYDDDDDELEYPPATHEVAGSNPRRFTFFNILDY